MDLYIEQAGLGHILEKVRAGKRLSLADGKTLYEHPNILALGYLANIVRERLNGKRVYFIYNQHINYSNICVNLCKFCAFGREREDPLAYEMDKIKLEYDELVSIRRAEVADKIREARSYGDLSENAEYNAANYEIGRASCRERV